METIDMTAIDDETAMQQPSKQPRRAIDIAVIGNTDNGKSTFVNALLGCVIAEVNENKCTEGIHRLRFCHSDDADGDDGTNDAANNDAAEKIKTINADGKSSMDQETVQTHLIELPRSCRTIVDMHHNLDLVLSDYPGFDSDMKYRDHFLQQHQKHDMVVLILDTMVANKPESFGPNGTQRGLVKDVLEFAKRRGDGEPVPILLILNKVDEDCDSDTMKRVETVRKCIQDVLRGKDGNAGDGDDDDGNDDSNASSILKPFVLPLSAKNALMYRAMAGRKQADIAKLPDNNTKCFLKDICGNRMVAQMSPEARVAKTFEVSRPDSEEYKTCIGLTGFPKLLDSIQECIGGADKQGQIVAQQLRLRLKETTTRSKGAQTENEGASSVDVGADTNITTTNNNPGYIDAFIECVQEQKRFCPQAVPAQPNCDILKAFHNGMLDASIDAFTSDPNSTQHIKACFEELVQIPDIICSHFDLDGNSLSSEMLEWVQGSVVGLLRRFLATIETNFVGWLDAHFEQSVLSSHLHLLKEALDEPGIARRIPTERKAVSRRAQEYANGCRTVPEPNWATIATMVSKYLDAEREKMVDHKISKNTEAFKAIVAAAREEGRQEMKAANEALVKEMKAAYEEHEKAVNAKLDAMMGMLQQYAPALAEGAAGSKRKRNAVDGDASGGSNNNKVVAMDAATNAGGGANDGNADGANDDNDTDATKPMEDAEFLTL